MGNIGFESGGDKSGGDKSGGDKSGGDKSGGDKFFEIVSFIRLLNRFHFL